MQNMGMKNFDKRCVVIGTTRLCISILNQLVDHAWNILYVVSDDPVVRDYCFNKNLKLVEDLEQVNENHFVLFSVANYLIIPSRFLSSHAVSLAINYHDSLLPKYAGVNSTTWAIYNNESSHGVSWHLISSGIDEGGLLKQSSIPLSKDETAFSLNLKCFEEAVRTFISLLKDIENGTLEIVEQDVTSKSYYGKEYIPENYGIIDFCHTYEEIERLYRSLYFGEEGYSNTVASVKIWDGKKSYLVGSINFLEKENAVPGYVYSISQSALNIGIKDGILSIQKLMTHEGLPLSFNATHFKVDQIVSPYRLTEYEKNSLSTVRKAESKAFKAFKSEQWKCNSFFPKALTKEDQSQYQFTLSFSASDPQIILHKIAFVLLKFINQDLCIPIKNSELYSNNLKNQNFNKAGTPDLQQQSVAEAGHVRDTWPMEAAAKMEMPAKLKTDSSSCLGIYCARSSSSSCLGIFATEFLREFIKHESFIYLRPSQQQSLYSEFIELLNSQLNIKYAIARDFSYRYHFDADRHDIGIFMSKGDSWTETSGDDLHRLMIFIDETSVRIQGNQQDKILLDSICLSIRYVLSEMDIPVNARLQNITVIPPDEYQKILVTWNQTEKDYPKNKTICQLFEEQVLKTPNDIALVFNQESLTFRALNEKSNQLARHIRREYLRITGFELCSNTPIPICMERSLEAIIGFLAIMKAGAAYVPIDPSYPTERISYILQDTKCRLFLTQAHLVHLQTNGNVHSIVIDKELCTRENDQNLISYSQSTDLAYLIFTSGTTGNPKGVMIEHDSVINMIWALEEVYDFDPTHKKTSCFTSFIFDVSVSEIFSSLLRGGELHLFDNEHKYSPELLSKYINEHKINYLYLPPAILGLLPKCDYPSLRAMIFAGEPCDQSVGAYWATKHKLYNYYGPTECTVYATGKLVHVRNVNEIGKPLHNKKAYILDSYLNPVPIGVVGELYIGGVGQALGYLNLPELTKERFLSNHLQTDKNKKLYKTGDQVRWLSDGNIEYIGRNDFQVKIRGYRVELGEIERVLSKYPGIEQSVVLVKEHIDEANYKSLVGFYVAKEVLDQTEIIKYLQSKIPDYMVPNLLVQLEQFPTTLTGKLDRSKLLNIKMSKQDKYFIPPASEIEKSVFALWAEILKTNQISLDDVFFQVGGNSLLAIVLQTKLNALFKLDFSILTLFQYPTIRSLSNHIASKLNKNPPSPQSKDSDYLQPACISRNISSDIAIIGMACRVPGANSIQEFWHNLTAGVESIQNISQETLKERGLDVSEIADKNYVKRAGNIDRYYGFDAEFFGFTPKEAQSMDPQHRHFMEVVFEALEDSGYDLSSTHEQIGLYAGQGENVYYLNQVFGNQSLTNDLGDFQLKINNDKDFLTTKVSYKLNLCGPSLDIQTACSTSLVAIHIAISQLLAGDCEVAVAGGVSIAQRFGYKYKKGMIESADGVCRAFDQSADGTIISSGVGVVVLKPLAKALEDGNHIYAIIKATAINNDGGGANKIGYTAPSIHGQTQVIKRALKKSNVDPATISYIETHGTGTKIGDPIELSALHQVFFEHQQKEHSIAIGSVKSNIGHTDAAAGVIGLIKTALALKHRQIPASLHFNEWNPEIKSFNKIFYVNRSLADWPAIMGLPRRAGVSSFGIGGTNAHAILEEAPTPTTSKTVQTKQLCVLSAETETSLQNYLLKLHQFIDQKQSLDLAQLAYTLQLGRTHRSYRCYVISDSIENLKNQLLLLNQSPSRLVRRSDSSDLIFMFSGQGSQYVNMAEGIYHSQPYFAQIVDDCSLILKERLNLDLLPILFNKSSDNTKAADLLKQTQYAQLAVFVIEYAMSKFLMYLGIQPTAFIGHSVGEYVAATLAEVFSLEDALFLVMVRGKIMQSTNPGAMLSVQLSYDELLSILPHHLDVAAVNGPNLCVVSGEPSDISLFSQELSNKNVEHSPLHTSHAFHSRMMQPILREFSSLLEKMVRNEPKIPIISNVTGSELTAAQATGHSYWCNHIRMPVLFYQGIKKILNDFQAPRFIEVGPGRTLTTLVKQTDKQSKAVHTIPHPKQKETDEEVFLQAIGELWQGGIKIDWKRFHQNGRSALISLPTYCFDHKDYCIEPDRKSRIQRDDPSLLNGMESYSNNLREPSSYSNSQHLAESRIIAHMKEIWQSVLGLKEVRLEDNFFELGGHSLLATQLISHIEKTFGVQLEIRDVFLHPCLQEMCKRTEQLSASIEDEEKKCSSNDSDAATDITSPLSAQQAALCAIQELHGPDFNAYNEPLLFEINGDFSLPIFQQAIQALVDRHEILRSVFIRNQEGHLYQKSSPLNIHLESVVCESNDTDQWILNEIEKPFDLKQGPLFRTKIFDIGRNQYLVLMVFHHAIVDGASLRILCRELSEAYNAILEKRSPNLPQQQQYRDYIYWQRNLFETEEYRKKISYWKDKLLNYQEVNLTQNRPRKSIFSYQGEKYYFDYGADLSLKLSKLAKQEKTTLFNIFLAGLAILLSRYCRQDDILIGAPMLNRPTKDFHNVLGFFTNTVVLRNSINTELSFKELLRLVSINTLSAYEQQEVSFDHIVSHLNIERDASRNPLVQVMLLVVNKNNHPELKLNHLKATFIDPPAHPIAKMDLSLGVFEKEHSLTGYFEYSTDVFERNTIILFAKHLQRLLLKVVDYLEQPLKTLSIIDQKDEQTLLIDWNPKYKKRPDAGTLHEAFIETARKLPNKIAIKFGNQSLTYAELDAKSTQLARYIQNKYKATSKKESFPADTLIGICVEPSFDTIISILGVLKAGGAYVPMDPNYPATRIENILLDSQAPLIIVHQRTLSKISSLAELDPDRLILIDDSDVQDQIQSQSVFPLDATYNPESLAYVIYTSGSTGRPKGVALPHANVLNLFYATKEYYHFNQNDVWVLFHSFAFDVSVWEIWGTFLYGGTLIIVSYETTRDPHTFYEITKKEKITVLNQTPSAFRNYIDADLAAENKINTLRCVIFAGEALDIEMLRDWWRSHDDRHPQLVNMYGITETTIHASYQALFYSDLENCRHGRIGVPLNHLRMYVLDEQKSLCPIGVPGELYVGGGGVARGYLNRDDLTNQRFIINPFAKTLGLAPTDRIYKSGDLVRWMPDGTLEYIGRTDFQVKLRGFRIELGEIESVIIKYPAIKQSVVVMREDGHNKYLACYFTLNPDSKLLDLEMLRTHLRQSLPEYMVPSAFVRLDKIPLTVNGKIDRKALPKPDLSEMGGLYTPPSNELELEITNIWAELLQIDAAKISIDANYFQLGGNSLSIVNMITKVKALSGVDLPFSIFWKAPTIKSIAKVIEGKKHPINDHLEKIKQLIINDLILPDSIKPLKTVNPALYQPKKVLLTGATGFLGTYLINELSKIADLEIYCLIRAQSPVEAKQRLNATLVQNQMSHLTHLDTIKAVCGDLSQENLGLTAKDYADLADKIDVIYHNGALVHHLYDYERMRSANVSSTHELLKLAVTRKNKAIHFISTISVMEFDIRHKLKVSHSNWSFLELNGYLLTKWVSEQLILQAAKRGVVAQVYRPGNITGHSKTGHCQPAFNHTLLKIKGFVQLGQAYFDEDELFEMVPVDLLAKEIIEKSLHPQKKIIFNMDNPNKIKFSSYVQKFIQNDYLIKKVASLSDWRQILSSLNEENALFSLRAFYDHYEEIQQVTLNSSNLSDLTCSIPHYEQLISTQIEFLEKLGFIHTQEKEQTEYLATTHG